MKPRKQVKNGGGCKVSLLMAALCVSAAWAGVADVVQGLNAPNGTLAVDSGTTVLTNGFDATLPEVLATSAVLWFSADKNVITNEGGGVTEWRDVREEANAESRLYNAALAFLPEEGEAGYEFRSELPVLVTTNRLFRPDTKAVDFGSYGSGRWLYFAAPGDTNRLRVTIGSFFTVVGFDNTCGHILGDVSALATGGSGVMFFHKGLGAQGRSNISTATEANSVMHLGETRLNGTRIDPRNVAYNYNAFQLFSQNGPDNPSRGKPYASTFFNNANFKASNGGTLARQCGGTLVEFTGNLAAILLWPDGVFCGQLRAVTLERPSGQGSPARRPKQPPPPPYNRLPSPRPLPLNDNHGTKAVPRGKGSLSHSNACLTLPPPKILLSSRGTEIPRRDALPPHKAVPTGSPGRDPRRLRPRLSPAPLEAFPLGFRLTLLEFSLQVLLRSHL